MGQVVNTLQITQRVQIAAHYPIHKTIAQLIPILEQRQYVAKKYEEVSLNTEKLHHYLDIIRECEKQMSEILGMQIPVI